MKILGALTVFTLLASTVLVGTPAFADSKGVSCGPGKKVMEGKSGMDSHLIAWGIDTVIQFFVPVVTFAISSGTSGCNSDAVVEREKTQEAFVANAMDNLSVEMAQGGGQYVDTMANLMGCPGEAREQFSRFGQARYETLFRTPGMDAKAWLVGLRAEMSQDAVLNQKCAVL